MTGGAGASPLTSLEDKLKTVDLQLEELTVKDQHLAGLREDLKTRDLLVTELREKLHHEELLSKQLGKGVSHLQSDLKKTSTAKDGLSEEVRTLRATLAIKEAELHRLAEDSNEQIGSLADIEEQSSREVLRLREVLKQRSSQLDVALQSLDIISRAQQTLENEKAQLAQSVDRFSRRMDHKNAVHKKELDEADKVQKELEEKLLEQVKQRSELSLDFENLKTTHLELVQIHNESDQAVTTKQRVIEVLQNNLAIAQAQAATHQEDILHEKEAKHAELKNLTEQSATVINIKETRIRELEKENKELTQRTTGLATAEFQQLQEDYQISQSQIIAYKKQMDIGKKELEWERRKVEEERMEVEKKKATIEQKQSRIDGLNSQLRLLSTENVQLKRAARNYQMESTRADRLQNELEHMTAQNREIDRLNAQLKVSNQTLLQRLVTKGGKHTTTVVAVEGLSDRKERGRGSYGAVYEVRVNGVPCIAKRLHDILVGRGGQEPVGAEQRAGAISKFKEECDLLSGLRHPNVVQFMGVHYGRDEADISLIMEYMHMDLEHCMKTYPNIPLPYKTSILRDVAYGLAYLHSIPIIHRDLNAGNVLLTESLRAKIADLGVAKLFESAVAMRRTRTLCPGAQDFMSPESCGDSPKYDDKLDVFSFGHLAIYLVNQKAPYVLDRTMTGRDFARQQVQVGKRRTALDQMGGPRHPLYTTVVQCLSDTPDQRPTSRDLVRRMEESCQLFPIPCKNTLELEKWNAQLKSSNQVLQTKLKDATRQ